MRTASSIKTGLREAPLATKQESQVDSDTTRTGAVSVTSGKKSRLRNVNRTLRHRQRVAQVGKPTVSMREADE